MVPWQAKIRQGHKKLQMVTQQQNTEETWDNSNGPDSPPVVADYSCLPQQQQQHDDVQPEDEDRCRNCASTNLFTDWKQGDRVCTDCGVVAEERLRDDRPEWKDFNDAEDLVKKGCTSVAKSSARSGMVPVDESKYIGGLQPTTLSKLPFGGSTSGGYGLARIQRRLRTTNRRLDLLMEKQHKRELKDAKIQREIHIKKDKQTHPERYHVLHEEHDDDDDDELQQKHAALHNEKWSLDRAILLYGNDEEESSSSMEDREELRNRLDLTLQTASRDLYNAYTSTTLAIQELDLPDKVRQEILHRLVRYAIQRDGLTVKGVSNRLSKKESSSGGSNMLRHSAAERKKLNDRLKDYNKRKQSSALGAALIHLTAKSMGHPRAIAKICACFLSPPESTIGMDQQQVKKVTFVKGKHCSKAINEIKATFPEYVAAAAKAGANGLLQVQEIPGTIWSSKLAASKTSLADPHISESVDNFAHHFLKTLQLPPVAEASIQTLLLQCRKEQIQLGKYSGVNMSTMCAAITYFVCSTGSIMQNLAQQVQQEQPSESAATNVKTQVEESSGRTKKRTLSAADTTSPPTKRTKLSDKTTDNDSSSDDDSLGDYFNMNSLVGVKPTKKEEEDDDDDEPFDVFSHAPIVEDQSEKQRYEMRRMWDAWKEQMPWARSSIRIEQSCGVARNKLLEFYSTELYPQREQLLEKLKESSAATGEGGGQSAAGVLQSTPMAKTLLGVVSTAASLMSLK